jgi:hypothetical protein
MVPMSSITITDLSSYLDTPRIAIKGMNERSAVGDEGSPFFIYTVTEESLEFFSRDVFLRSFLYVLRLKESSKP